MSTATASSDTITQPPQTEVAHEDIQLEAGVELALLADDLAEAAPEVSDADSLLMRLRAGENSAWDEFVTTWSPRIFSYLRYSLPTREDAEDAVGETLVAAVEAIRNFDGKSSLSTWLYAIARRKMADHWRRAQDTTELSELFQATPNGISLEFRDAIARLPAHTRQALLLRYREGFSVGEVATILGRSYKATESLLSRGRNMLATELNLGANE